MQRIARFVLPAALLLVSAVPSTRAAPAPAAVVAASCYTLTKDDGRSRDICIREATFNADVCKAIESFSNTWKLPAGFFARLVWQESRFDPGAVSPAGAQGIAQFMPETGRLQGLKDAFDPAEALARSAAYLHWLDQKFGNLGLAAAAYNAGEGALTRLTTAGGGVPYETENYVSIVTGHPVAQWLSGPVDDVDYTLSKDQPFQDACIQMASVAPMPQLIASADWQPWGVMLAQDFSPAAANRKFERLQRQYSAVIGDEAVLLLRVRNPNFGRKLRYSAMIGRNSQAEAQNLCRALTAAGGMCLVQRNK
ncbi:MAG TPA: lytic transglycosylase domain-containing protein [Devosiaceae bacterium]